MAEQNEQAESEPGRDTKLNVYQRFHNVMATMQRIAMTQTTSGPTYKYAKHDSVTEALRPHLIANGLLMLPSVTNWSVEPITLLVKGQEKPATRTTADIRVDVVNIDDPSDRFSLDYFGIGIDDQDKGPGKAMSYAFKYACLKALALRTGDDVEADDHEGVQGQPAARGGAGKATNGTAAPRNPFVRSTMDDLDAWFDGNTDKDAKATCSKVEAANAAKRAAQLLLGMVEGAPDSAGDIHEKWGHWWTFFAANSAELSAWFGKSWADKTGQTQEAAE